MKILLTAHQFLPEYSAGTEILTFDAAKELQRLGHEVFVFTGYPERGELEDSERFDRYVYDGIPVERFRYTPVPMGGQSNIVEAEYNNLFVASHFRDYLHKIKPDIAHFFHLQRLSVSAIDVCDELGIPMVLTPTDFWLVCFTNQLLFTDNTICPGPDESGVNCLRHVVALTQPSRIQSILEKVPDSAVGLMIRLLRKGMFSRRWFAPFVTALSNRTDFMKSRMNKLDRVIVPTRLMEDILKKYGLLPEKIIFSPYGINLTHLTGVVRHDSDKLRIGFIGTLAEYKGAHILLKAVRSISEGEPIELKIYGKIDDFPEYVKELRLIAGDDKRIEFCGTFPNDRIGEIFASLDVLVVPSIWYENTPLVIYSAQAAGCPVIATNLGGMSEAVEHEVNGLLFGPCDISGLADAIRRLIHDRKLLKELSGNAHRPKSIPEYVEEIIMIYREVLEEKQVPV